jgi:hypothetical protein
MGERHDGFDKRIFHYARCAYVDHNGELAPRVARHHLGGMTEKR